MTRGARIVLPFAGSKERGPNGRRLCKLCGTEVPERRKGWCSQDCVDRYMLQHQSVARDRVWRRDAGVCALCGVGPGGRPGPLTRRDHLRSGDPLFRSWQADHIVPLVEGGEHTMENLRTLCWTCHQQETRGLRRRMSERRARTTDLFPAEQRAAPAAEGPTT